jgi:hypothetical protein
VQPEIIWTVLTAALLCLAALGLSKSVDKIFGVHKKQPEFYECGFINHKIINFFDQKMLLMPVFIVLEMMIFWMFFCSVAYVCFEIQPNIVTFGLFPLVMIVCLKSTFFEVKNHQTLLYQRFVGFTHDF